MKKIIFLVAFFLAASILITIYFDGKELKEYNKNIYYMDTHIAVRVYVKDNSIADNAFKEVEKIYKHYHELSDRYNEYSGIKNVWYINNNEVTNGTMQIDPDLYKLLELGKEWYYLSDNLFNINMGELVDIWKKYKDSGTGIPSESELENIGSINIEDIELLGNNTIKNTHPNIDLGGMAKGYATAAASKYLEMSGIDTYLINAGGNVIVGNHYDDEKYKVGIENPNDITEVYQVIKGNNITVVTSGGYERFYEYNGVRYHHIIDPFTKEPANHMKAVTVVTKDSVIADMLSTTLFLMPIEVGMEYIKNFEDAEAVWYSNTDMIFKSAGFSLYE